MWTDEEKWKQKVESKNISVGVVGGGYVGLGIATLFARNGFIVTVYDIDRKKVELLKHGKNYILDENWLNSTVKESVKKGRLKASVDVKAAATNDVIFIDVPSTTGKNFDPTSEFIVDICEKIGNKIKGGVLVIVESTVVLGETENTVKNILEGKSGLRVGRDFGLAFSPERIDPGNKIMKMWNIPKVVGGVDKLSTELTVYLFKKVIDDVVSVSNPRTAEFIKLMELSQRATLIAHIFEMAKIAEEYGIDIKEAIDAAKTKWNFIPMKSSCGVGGYCVTPSVKSIIKTLKHSGMDSKFFETVKDIIEDMPRIVAKKTIECLKNDNKNVKNSKIGILGITYKANIKDHRASVVKDVVKTLRSFGIKRIIAYDPLCNQNNVDWVELTDLNEIYNCNYVIICVDHDEFRGKEFKEKLIKEAKKRNFKIIDPANIFDAKIGKYPCIL